MQLIIENEKIINTYNDYEIKMQFINFLETELKQEKLDLYEIKVDRLSEVSQNRLEKIDKLNFINY